MKLATVVARILQGLIFTVFGLNLLFNFLPMPMPHGEAGAMMLLMYSHKWLVFYGCVETAAGLMLLFNRFVVLSLTLLAGLIVNIMLFHLTLAPEGVLPGLVTGVLEVFLVYAYRDSFEKIFAAKHEPR